MNNYAGHFSTFQLYHEKERPGPTEKLKTPFNKSSKKPKQPKPFIPNSAIAKVNVRMDSVEKTLIDYMPLVNRLIEEECLSKKQRKESMLSSQCSFSSTSSVIDFDETTQNNDSHDLVKLAQRKPSFNPKSLDLTDYPQVLIPHFFAINEYCSYPRVLEISEYVNTFRRQPPPDYLISAMVADSSLVSPYKHLHQQNMEFFEYHYQLSLKQMLPYLAKPNIVLIQAILILWEADHNMGNFSRCIERMTCAIRLSQTLSFHQINDPNSRIHQMYPKQELNTIRKLWDLMHFRDHQIAQLINRPALLPPYQQESNHKPHRRSGISHQELLAQSKHPLPKYYDTFLSHCPQLANILTQITHLVSGTNRRCLIVECRQLLNDLDDWHSALPNYIKYFPVCLSIEHRLNSPMITMRILSHLIMLNGKLVLLRYMLNSSAFLWERLNEQMEMINLTIKICHHQLQMLQDWFQYTNTQLLAMMDDGLDDDQLEQLMKPPFPIEYFCELGFVYLQLMRNLREKSVHKLNYVRHDYEQLTKLLDYFGKAWDGATAVLSTLECWNVKIDSSEDSLPQPLIQFNCDRFFQF